MTTENNKLIAKFLGYNKTTMNNGKKELWTIGNTSNDKNYFEFVNGLTFDSDWNWLMEVVEKIESLRFKVNIFGFNEDLKIYYISIHNSENGTISIVNERELSRIQAVYNACIEFIKWYNQNGAKEN